MGNKAMKALLAEMRDLARREDEALASRDGTRKAETMDGRAEVAKQLTAQDDQELGKSIKKARKADLEARVEQLARAMHKDRGPSKAAAIGNGAPVVLSGSRLKANASNRPHPALKAAFRDYKGGEFLLAMGAYKGWLTDGIDPEVASWGKAKLAEFTQWAGKADLSQAYTFLDGAGKATLGTTNATGGYVLPNNLVDTVVKPNVQKAIYQTMLTVVNGVAVRGVDQPYRLAKPPRATFQDWGATKENLNETYGSYTATLGTLARIYDVSKQYLRFSAGSAEQDVMDELTKAIILGENYYIIAGAGTGSVGTGDPTYGIYTALAAAAAFNGYTTSFTASATTLAGSFASALATAGGALASRNRESQAWVVDATTFWTAVGQGTDYAGFFVSPAEGPTGFGRTASGGLTFWNIPIFYDSNLGTNATTKIAIGGEWDAAKLYRGMEFRIDSSDVAGTRWDQNLVGFRGEEEIGFHAGTAVNIGAFQLITGAIP